MDKIARYNQKLLAILGTLALLALVVILSISLVVWIFSIYDDFDDVDNTLYVTDSLVQKDGKINQMISFGEPDLIDTLNNIYIISVSQRTLEKPIEKEQMRLNKMGSSSSIYYDDYNTEGSYNNIIIYRKTTGEKQALFDNRINITRYYDRIINEKVYLFVVGTKGDTNKDESYSNDDLENLYIYDLENDYLKTISLDQASFEGSVALFESDELVIEFGIDINLDGEYDASKEPILLKHYSIASDELTDFIPVEMQQRLQKIVD